VTERLIAHGVELEVLESDAIRRAITPSPTYSAEERDIFYAALEMMGELLVKHGVAVIFDATAHRRAWRDAARRRIARFAEVHVDCPVERCMARDPKGIYRQAGAGIATAVPGVHVAYEPPIHPDVVVHGTDEPHDAASRVLDFLFQNNWIGASAGDD
jgi:adenylylsulfate kinase